MTRWQFVLLIVFQLALAISSASAQTVIAINAPPGSNVEFLLSGSVVASGAAAADGVVRLPAKTPVPTGQTLDAFVFVDVCESVRRVHIVGRLQPIPPNEGCTRTQILGVFVVQNITSLVFDMKGTPTMVLRQGAAPEEWVYPPAPRVEGPRVSLAPVGVVLSGGVGMSSVNGFATEVCGNVTSCTADDGPIVASGAATYWITKFIGVEAGFLKPRSLTAEGSGTTYRFDSGLNGSIATLAGQVGVPFGRVRLFGTAGADYYKATLTTNQTVDERTVTVNDVATTIPGGSQTFQWRTTGWGLVLGGGGEVWITSRVGIFGEFKRFEIRGEDERLTEAEADYDVNSVFVGVRVRIF